MFKEYESQPDIQRALRDLYALMLKGKLDIVDKAKKKALKRSLRDLGLLSLPFSCNPKNFSPHEHFDFGVVTAIKDGKPEVFVYNDSNKKEVQ